MKWDSVENKAVDLFELTPDESFDNYIEARHQWGLPGVRCEVCGATWANVGVAYPTADLSSLANSERYTKGWPVPWNEFEQARRAILPLLPPKAIAPPGTGLGPLLGRARGTFPEIAWQNPWTMLVAGDAFVRLRQRGIRRLAGAVAGLAGKDLPELLELQLEPHGHLVSDPPPASTCTLCGRQAITRPSRVVIERSSIPSDHDLFRLGDLTTMIVGTAEIVSALGDLGFRGARFEQVAVSS